MKKVLISLFVFICSLSLFAQNNSLPKFFPYANNLNSQYDAILASGGQRALCGDVSQLESLSDFDLAKLSNKDLRFLRNMVYAKHGHIFEAEDLTKYFSIFEWYKPVKKIKDSDLSETELELIKRIQIFETRNENKKAVATPSQLIGFWQFGLPVVASGYADGFVFENEKELSYKLSQMITLKAFCGYSGEYKISGNVLIFYAKKATYLEVVPNYEEWDPGWEVPFKDWGKGTKMNTIIFEEPLVFKFPLSTVENKAVKFWNEELIRNTVTIGSSEAYQILTDPNKY